MAKCLVGGSVGVHQSVESNDATRKADNDQLAGAASVWSPPNKEQS